MPANPLKFRQRELTRAVRAMQRAGVEVDRVEITPDGKITIVTKPVKPLTGWEDWDKPQATEWDDIK